MTAVLDTSFLVALTNTKERNHGPVLNIARTISDPLILPISILPEVCSGHVVQRLSRRQVVGGCKIDGE